MQNPKMTPSMTHNDLKTGHHVFELHKNVFEGDVTHFAILLESNLHSIDQKDPHGKFNIKI